MANFVHFFLYLLLLCEKNLEIALDNPLKNLMLKIYKNENEK